MAEEGRLLSDHEAQVVIQRSQSLQSFDIVEVRVEPWSSEPTGYCSKQLRVIIEFKLHTGNDLKLSFFVKSIPDCKDRESLEYYSRYFRSEFVFFNEILPTFGVCSDLFTPRCFYSRPDLLVMEDLSREGFTPPPTRDLMPYDECVATLQALARLHAASLAFEEHQPERKTVADSWPDVISANTTGLDDVDEWLVTGLKTLEYLTDIVPGIDDKEMLKKHLAEKRNHIIKVYNDKTSKFRNVLSHGDIWQGNTLRRRSTDGNNVDVKLIDFQVLCFAPLGYDVIFFLHQVYDGSCRRQHEDSLLSAYYRALADTLQTYCIDITETL